MSKSERIAKDHLVRGYTSLDELFEDLKSMKKTKYTVSQTCNSKKDYRPAMKRGLNIRLPDGVITALAMGEPLPERNRDHALSGNRTGYGECHIEPGWLLIYRIEVGVLVLTLTRTGTHSGLFGK